MESWERTIRNWWVEEEVPVKWAMNELLRGRLERVVSWRQWRAESQDKGNCQWGHCSPEMEDRKWLLVVSEE